MLRDTASASSRAASWAIGVWALVWLSSTGCRDIARYSKAAPSDQRVADLVVVDTAPADMAAAVDHVVVADRSPDTIDWASCQPVDIPDSEVLCTETCTATSGSADDDCDGLPSARDPQTDLCNALMVNGDLTQPSDAPSSPLIMEAVTEGCAAAAMGKRSKLAVAHPPTSGTFVVEACFTLGQVWVVDRLWVALHIVPFVGSELINCELWVHWDSTGHYQLNPGLHTASSSCGGRWTGDSDFPDEIGTVYTLQAIWQGQGLKCRLFDSDDNLMAEVSSAGCTTAPLYDPLVHLVTANRDATAHYLRVYQLH